jgi:hypothetical protein
MERLVQCLAWCALAFLGAAFVAGCETTPTYTPATVPNGAQAVPIRVLGARGIQGVPPPYVIAATSVSSLESLVDALYCHRAAGCASFDRWAPITGVTGDVVLALPRTPGFDIESVAAWRGSGSTIMIAEGLLRTCQGGECTAAMESMDLAVVPRTALRDATVVFQVAGQPSRSTVDLDPGASAVPRRVKTCTNLITT